MHFGMRWQAGLTLTTQTLLCEAPAHLRAARHRPVGWGRPGGRGGCEGQTLQQRGRWRSPPWAPTPAWVRGRTLEAPAEDRGTGAHSRRLFTCYVQQPALRGPGSRGKQGRDHPSVHPPGLLSQLSLGMTVTYRTGLGASVSSVGRASAPASRQVHEGVADRL